MASSRAEGNLSGRRSPICRTRRPLDPEVSKDRWRPGVYSRVARFATVAYIAPEIARLPGTTPRPPGSGTSSGEENARRVRKPYGPRIRDQTSRRAVHLSLSLSAAIGNLADSRVSDHPQKYAYRSDPRNPDGFIGL